MRFQLEDHLVAGLENCFPTDIHDHGVANAVTNAVLTGAVQMLRSVSDMETRQVTKSKYRFDICVTKQRSNFKKLVRMILD